jgi:hypothetical protein
MIEPALHGSQAGYDIAEAFPVGQLGEGQAKKLIETKEVFDFVVPAVAPDAFAEFVHRQESHDLGEDGRLGVHRSLLYVVEERRLYKIAFKSITAEIGRILCITCMMEDFSFFSIRHY